VEKEAGEKGGFSVEEFEVGFTAEGVMVVSIPLRKWTEDLALGDVLIVGTFEKAKRIALKNMEIMRAKAKQTGIVTPASPLAGGRNPSGLGVA
jgi:hypothetical protein